MLSLAAFSLTLAASGENVNHDAIRNLYSYSGVHFNSKVLLKPVENF